MNPKTQMILIAGGALLLGGIATATFMGKDSSLDSLARTSAASPSDPLTDAVPLADVEGSVDAAYADILSVTPVREADRITAQVVAATPVSETVAGTRNEEVCENVVVNERQAERDGNVGGTVAGALIGGLVGNQVGGGSGRKAATVAGAVAGGVIGNQIDKRHEGGKVVQRTERQCHTREVPTSEEKVVAWNVDWRTADGRTGTLRQTDKPSGTVEVEGPGKVTGYDVSYRFQSEEGQIRMNQRPQGDRLPVRDGKVVGEG